MSFDRIRIEFRMQHERNLTCVAATGLKKD